MFLALGHIAPKGSIRRSVGYLTQRGQVEFDKLIGMTTNDPALENLGDGTFLYEGVKVPNIEGTTIWRMTLYGSVVSNQLLPTDLQTSTAHVITAQRGKCLYYFDND
jgi:hypothetical protein